MLKCMYWVDDQMSLPQFLISHLKCVISNFLPYFSNMHGEIKVEMGWAQLSTIG